MRRGLSRAAVGFLKEGVREENACRRTPLRVQALRSSIAPTPGLPIPILLQPDFGREQNPKRPHRSPGPSPHQTGKERNKVQGTGTATCHARLPPPEAREPGRSSPPPRRHRAPLSTTPRPAPAGISQDSKPPRPRAFAPPRSGKLPKKRDDCGERRRRRGVPAQAGRLQR